MRKALYLACCLLLPVTALAQTQVITYLKQFRKAMSNCSMAYRLSNYYPDGSKMDVAGLMAIQQDKFFDSSNVRFVLLNERWYVAADHLNQFIAVSYLPDINKRLGGAGKFTSSQLLLNEVFTNEHLVFKVLKEEQSRLVVSLNLEGSDMIEKLEIELDKTDFLPLSYDAVFNIPISLPAADNLSGELPKMKIRLSCYNIRFPASDHLFDHKRLIREERKKAVLTRYNHYKTILPNR